MAIYSLLTARGIQATGIKTVKSAKSKAQALANKTNSWVKVLPYRKGYRFEPSGESQIKSNPTKIRVKTSKGVFPAVAKRVNGRVKIFVTEQVARKINPSSSLVWRAVYEKGKERKTVTPAAPSHAKAKLAANRLMRAAGYSVGARGWRLISLYNSGVQAK